MTPVEKLKKELSNNKGVRVGQTAVVSKKVHITDSSAPQIINIITNSDAGTVFYNRFKTDEVVHIDLFHEVKVCDVKQLACILKENLYNSCFSQLIDYIDIQTGSGGGRLSGSLNYGMTESLKKSHMNHVHLALLTSDDLLDVVFFLVEIVEEGLKEQKIELRQIEKIIHQIGNSPMDMSPYASNSDSFLKQNSINDSEARKDAAELIEMCESVQGVRQILEFVKEQSARREMLNNMKKKYPEMDEILKFLRRKDLIDKCSNRYTLTPKGEILEQYIRTNCKELELFLKNSLKKDPAVTKFRGVRTATHLRNKKGIQAGSVMCKPISLSDWIDELDIVETCKNALVRNYKEKTPFGIEGQDISTLRRLPKLDQDICLIIDASASMSGYRLRNAKYLAKQLLVSSKRRLSVLAFQEKEVKVFVPFTKDFHLLDCGLDDIVSIGLTPLALALHQSLSYMKAKRLRNPLIILITDGIPTVPLWSTDPIKDAIIAAQEIANKNISFCCIGLQPNKDFLVKITKAAKGKLFIMEELNRDSLLEATMKSGQVL